MTDKISIGQKVNVSTGVDVSEILFGNKAPFKASFFNIDPKTTTPLDSHAVKEVWIVVRGHGTLTVNQETPALIKQGESIFFEPFQTHFVTNTGTETLEMISIWWP